MKYKPTPQPRMAVFEDEDKAKVQTQVPFSVRSTLWQAFVDLGTKLLSDIRQLSGQNNKNVILISKKGFLLSIYDQLDE